MRHKNLLLLLLLLLNSRKISTVRFCLVLSLLCVGFLEPLLKDLTSLRYKLRNVCLIMKQFWPRLCFDQKQIISSEYCVFLSLFLIIAAMLHLLLTSELSFGFPNCKWNCPCQTPSKNSSKRVSFTLYIRNKLIQLHYESSLMKLSDLFSAL